MNDPVSVGLTWLWTVVFVLGLAVMVVGLVLLWWTRSAAPHRASAVAASATPDTAQSVLSGRLAHGEIDDSVYRQRRTLLDER
ncbi:MAG: hypothetical protein ABIP45_06325 [Knoellia sp.]